MEMALKAVLMAGIFFSVLFVAILTMSAEDAYYLNTVRGVYPPLDFLIKLFLNIYGTPAYLVLVVLSRIAERVREREELLTEVMGDIEKVLSFPLVILSSFTRDFLSMLYRMEPEDEKRITHNLANAAGLVLLAGFYTRQLPLVIAVLILLPFSLKTLAGFWAVLKKSKSVSE